MTDAKLIMNLTEGFAPIKQGLFLGFKAFKFPAGEPHIVLEALPKVDNLKVHITSRLNTAYDMMLLAVAVDALRRAGYRRLSLVTGYFPGGRQDRVITAGEPLTIKVYANIINSFNFEEVHVLDPHSNALWSALDNLVVHNNHAYVAQALLNAKLDVINLVIPDLGAEKKAKELANKLLSSHTCTAIELIQFTKERSKTTGKLLEFHTNDEPLMYSYSDRPFVIVDDICDGGGTFIGIAETINKLLDKDNVKKVLIVTHGLFSNGTEKLKQHFDKVYSTNSFLTLPEKGDEDFIRILQWKI